MPSEARKNASLVLYLAANPNPISIRVTQETAGDLGPRLIQVIRTADDKDFVVNFSHVLAAHFV